MAQSQIFGNVNFSNSTNIRTFGKNNSGITSYCSNAILNAVGCQLHLRSSSNIKLDSEESAIVFKNSSNASIDGVKNNVNVDGCSNLRYKGSSSKIQALSTSNANIVSDNSTVSTKNDSNLVVNVQNANLVAENNSNLDVTGDGGNIKVMNTQNHTLKRFCAPGSSGEIQNKMEIISKSPNNRPTGFFGGVNSTKIYLTYADNVRIVENKYTVDNFELLVHRRSPVEVELVFDETNFDKGTFQKQIVGKSEVHITATKNGKTNKFTFMAPVIISSASNVTNKFACKL